MYQHTTYMHAFLTLFSSYCLSLSSYPPPLVLPLHLSPPIFVLFLPSSTSRCSSFSTLNFFPFVIPICMPIFSTPSSYLLPCFLPPRPHPSTPLSGRITAPRKPLSIAACLLCWRRQWLPIYYHGNRHGSTALLTCHKQSLQQDYAVSLPFNVDGPTSSSSFFTSIRKYKHCCPQCV